MPRLALLRTIVLDRKTTSGYSTLSELYDTCANQCQQTLQTSYELLNISKSLISWQSASFGKVAVASVLIGYCSSLGSVALAAFNLATVTVYLLRLPTVLMYAVESIINQSSKDASLVSLNFKRALLLAVLTGAASMVLMTFVPLPLFNLMGLDPVIIQMVQQYTAYFSLAVIPASILDSEIAVVNARNDRQILWYLSIFSFSTWFISCFLLMNVFHFGLSSLALGYVIDTVLSSLLMALYLKFSKLYADYDLFSNFNWDVLNCKEILYYSWPFTYDYITRSLMMFTRKSCLALIGVEALVIEQIAFQWLGFSDLLTEGVNQAATVKIAQHSENNNITERRHIGTANLFISFVTCLLLIIPLLAFPKFIASIYLNQDELNDLTLQFSLFASFAIVSVYKMLLKLNYAMTSNLLGALDTNVPNIINGVSSLTISAVMAYSLAGMLSLNFYGLFAVFIVMSTLSSGLIYDRWETKNIEADPTDGSEHTVWQFFKSACFKSEEAMEPQKVQYVI